LLSRSINIIESLSPPSTGTHNPLGAANNPEGREKDGLRRVQVCRLNLCQQERSEWIDGTIRLSYREGNWCRNLTPLNLKQHKKGAFPVPVSRFPADPTERNTTMSHKNKYGVTCLGPDLTSGGDVEGDVDADAKDKDRTKSALRHSSDLSAEWPPGDKRCMTKIMAEA
jgi:hypothetical protein